MSLDKLNNMDFQSNLKDTFKSKFEDTKIKAPLTEPQDLKKINLLLKRPYQINDSSEIYNLLQDFGVINDLYDGYAAIITEQTHTTPTKAEVTAMLFAGRVNYDASATAPKTTEQNGLSKNKPFPFSMPIYIQDALAELARLSSDLLNSNYDSLTELQKTLSQYEIPSYEFSQSRFLNAILFGVFKPDKKLQEHLLNIVCEDEPQLKSLIKIGYVTPISLTTRLQKRTSLQILNIYSKLIDFVTLDLVNRFDNWFFVGKNDAQIADSIIKLRPSKNHKTLSGEIHEYIKYYSMPIQLIESKLQYELFGKLMENSKEGSD